MPATAAGILPRSPEIKVSSAVPRRIRATQRAKGVADSAVYSAIPWPAMQPFRASVREHVYSREFMLNL